MGKGHHAGASRAFQKPTQIRENKVHGARGRLWGPRAVGADTYFS